VDINKLIRDVAEEVGVGTTACAQIHAPLHISAIDIPSKLEHSLLKPDLTAAEVEEACSQARRFGIAAVCVPPYYVTPAKKALSGSGVAVCAALGVPNALISEDARLSDAKYSIMRGADELDVSINAMAVKSGRPDDARRDLSSIAEAAKGKASLKAAVELSLFTEEERRCILFIIKECGIQYVKIQNVVSGKSADKADIRYVREMMGNNLKIKIDGGVKTVDHAMSLVAAGADRIGLTATFKIAGASTR
jgi:deoxyribose-phosphate aldolase